MYNENRIINAYEQYGQVKKAQANKGSTYDEVTQTVTSGLGSPLTFSTQEDPEDTRTFDQKIYDGLKRFGAALNPFSQPDRDSMLLDAYDNDDIFVIPEPTPVAETGIDDGSYDFIDMSKFAASPRQPRTQPNMDATPTVGISDEAPSQIKPLGLMSPPSMEQDMPDVPAATNLDVIKSLPNAPYTIQAGDTLGEIADVSGSSVEELMALNDIKDKDRIIAGKTIKIPIRRDEDAEIVTQATSMEELKPIKASYNPLALALPALKPSVSLEDAIVTRLKTEEGFEDEAYKLEGEEYFTIGYGHYGSDVKEGQKITKKEAEELLRYDVQTRMPQIKRAIKNFDNLSRELQVEIAQSWFRGGIAGSPKTIALINEGNWEEASKEFLDNNEYRTTKLRGVKRRMKGLSDMLKKEADK